MVYHAKFCCLQFFFIASCSHGAFAATSRGHVTMWATNSNLIGAQCEYANAPVNSITDTVLPSLLRSGFHCAIGDSSPAFGQGEHCGKCYRLTALRDTGNSGTAGQAGSAVVMVSNGGAGGAAHFDCILEGFQAITGAATGIFDVDFEEVLCDGISGGPVAINWADKNAYYCKMMFENVGGWGSVKSVTACLNGNNCKAMQRAGGATWTGCPQGQGTSMKFTLTQENPSGAATSIECNCQEPWPWNTGHRCTCPTNFAGSSTGTSGSSSGSSGPSSSSGSSSGSSISGSSGNGTCMSCHGCWFNGGCRQVTDHPDANPSKCSSNGGEWCYTSTTTTQNPSGGNVLETSGSVPIMASFFLVAMMIISSGMQAQLASE